VDTFEDPVLLGDGYTYEKEHITQWLKEHQTSPMTNAKLEPKQLKLVKNGVVRKLLAAGEDQAEVKELCRCPLTDKAFMNPVLLLCDGATYEKEALDSLLAKGSVGIVTQATGARRIFSPATGKRITSRACEKKQRAEQRSACAASERVCTSQAAGGGSGGLPTTP
jgi:hypothetical protein